MRGHSEHVHTDQDIIVTVCRRLIVLLEPKTTPQRGLETQRNAKRMLWKGMASITPSWTFF
jgi:hypothetical protein